MGFCKRSACKIIRQDKIQIHMVLVNQKQKDFNTPVVRHQGVFRHQISLWEAVALIVSSTVGAGVLGIPYAVSKVGIGLGIVYLVILGFLLMGLNLLLGSVVARSKRPLQLAGLSRKYIGRFGEFFMASLGYLTMAGALVIYIIGTGDTLAAIFKGTPFFWSVIFFIFATILIFIGMRAIKITGLVLTAGIIFVVIMIALTGSPHIEWLYFKHIDLAYLLFPYGVILFAFSASASIPEAHTILKDKDILFKKAIIISSLISIAIYIVFAVVVVGVTGPLTTEIATIGLGQSLGLIVNFLGNLFAFLAMGTSFIIIGLAMRDSLVWDYKVPSHLASLGVTAVPFVIFLLGLRQFIVVMDFVGGVFLSLQMLLIVLIYWQAKQRGDLKVGKYKLYHTALLVGLLVLALTIGAVYSVVKLF